MSNSNLQHLNLKSKSTKSFNGDFPNSTKSNKVADIDYLIGQLSSLSLSKDGPAGYDTILKGNVPLIISSQFGSVFLQELLEKSNDDLVKMLYSEVKPCLYSLLKQTYANYFCQLLFKKLDYQCKYEVVMEIVGNLSQVLRNMISFKAAVSILETPLKEETQDEVLKMLSTISKSTLISHARYLKVFEVLITYLNEDKIRIIIDIIEPVFSSLLKIKQGYFLLRKIIKKIENNDLKHKIINLIGKSGIADILSNNNGCLLTQCILKNFDAIKEVDEDHNESNDLDNSAVDLISIKSEIKNIQFSVDQGSTSTSGKSIGTEFEQLNIKSKIIEEDPVKYSLSPIQLNTCVNFHEDTPIVRLFDLYSNEIVFKYSGLKYTKPIYKSHKKIYNSFLSLSTHNLKERLINLITKNSSLQAVSAIIKNILIFSQNSFVIEQILTASRKTESLEFIKIIIETHISGLPQELNTKWSSFKSKLLAKAGCDLKAFDSKLIMGFDPEFPNSSFSEASANLDEDNFQQFVDCNQSFFEVTKRNETPKYSANIGLKNMNLLDHAVPKHSSNQQLPVYRNCSSINYISNNALPNRHYYPIISNLDQQFVNHNQYLNHISNAQNIYAFAPQIKFTNSAVPLNANLKMIRGQNYIPYSNIYQSGMQQVPAFYNFGFKH